MRAVRAGPRAGAVTGAAAGRSPRAPHGARTPCCKAGEGRLAWAERCRPGHGLCAPRWAVLAASSLYAVVPPHATHGGCRRNGCEAICLWTRSLRASGLTRVSGPGLHYGIDARAVQDSLAMLRGRAAHVLRAAASAASRTTLTFSTPLPRHCPRSLLATAVLLPRARLPLGVLQKCSCCGTARGE